MLIPLRKLAGLWESSSHSCISVTNVMILATSAELTECAVVVEGGLYQLSLLTHKSKGHSFMHSSLLLVGVFGTVLEDVRDINACSI